MKKFTNQCRVIILLLTTICCLIFASNTSQAVQRITSASNSSLNSAGYNPQDTWTVYVYICGSDLESRGGAASIDIGEIIAAKLPDNVRVLMQTGGAKTWQNNMVDPNFLQRYIYAQGNFTKVDQQPLASMGDPATLASFLDFGLTNYPADHNVFIFWNHGGGSVYGVAFDELYDNDSLTLNEMSQAFQATKAQQSFEIIGFDTCLMSTIDTAKTFAPIAKYLVASEEVEPGNGWNYTDWLNALGQNPGVNGAQLGKIICDTYADGCESYGTDQQITLSVTDLSQIKPLVKAYDSIGQEALIAASQNPSKFLARLGRSAIAAENYGGNTKEQGYTNMVDIGSLVKNSQEILPDNAPNLLSALDNCIVYRVNGPYRQQSSGLSGYFSYNGNINNFSSFSQVATASESFKHLFELLLNGKLTPPGKSYLAALGYDSDPQLTTLQNASLEDFPVSITADGSALLNLGSTTADLLKSVKTQLLYFDRSNDIILALGTDNDLIADWENGTFKDNFRNVWGAIDGHLVFMEITAITDTYNLYSVPILINDEPYNLRIAYDFNTAAYKILDANKSIETSGESDKNLRQLKIGDKLTTLHFMQKLSDNNTDLQQIPIDTFTLTTQPIFADIDMGDGDFAFMFEMTDMQNNTALSQVINFTVKDGKITTSIL